MVVRQILSELPGIFYQRPSPSDPLFKAPGDPVAVNDVIGLVEVMKSFNEARATMQGRFVRYLVNSDDEVMPGQPLAEIEV
jgi:biotin carboxyl carrier protein